jgi:tetratricopeptide (TPR) repeat protein
VARLPRWRRLRAGYGGSEAHALTNSAQVQHDLGHLKRAHSELIHALQLYRQIGDRAGEADVLGNLAALSCDAGNLAGALEQAQEALGPARLIGDPRTEIDALSALAAAHLRLSHYEQAAEMARTALQISNNEGTLYQQAQAHLLLATTCRELGDCQQSRSQQVTDGQHDPG